MDAQRLHRALAQGDWDHAKTLLAPLAHSRKAHPSIIYNYGKVLLELQHWSDAVSFLRRAASLMPDRAAPWFELGRACVKSGEIAEAQIAFETALKLSPDDTDARRNLGRILLRRGLWKLAMDVWTPLTGDPEADLALYRTTCELKHADAEERRQTLLRHHPQRAAVIRTLTRVSKGALPRDL